MFSFRTPRPRLAGLRFLKPGFGAVIVFTSLPFPSLADVPVRVAEAGTESIGALASLELRDQFGNADSLARWRGAPLVAVVVSVRRLAMIESWERDLRARIPGIRFLNVADLPADAPVNLERTAATLRKRVPAGVAVLMDPTRQWASTFALDTAFPNLLVFDAEGRLTARFRGRWTAALAAAVAQAVPPPGPPP